MTAPEPSAARPTVLELQGVHKLFGDNHVLRGVDLDVASHEVVVVIGASGSGKSTLMRTINLIERVDDGRILLSGDDITDPTVDVDKVSGSAEQKIVAAGGSIK